MKELTHYFEEREKEDLFSGVVLITQGPERLFEAAYGYADRAWLIPNTPAMRFDTASITKLFTSIATMQMIEQGALSFDTGVIDFLGIADTTISAAVTVYHLLTHSSGIGDDAEEEAGENYEDIWRAKPNYSVTETVDFLPQFVHKPANFAPGEGVRYCNCSFVLLGLIVEKITGMTYRDYVREHIFARAGMNDSDFYRMDRAEPNVATGYDPIYDDQGQLAGWKKNIYSYPPVGSPDGGAHVTARDLDRFLRTVHAGELLSPELTRAFLTPQLFYRDKGDWSMHYGFGLWFYVDRDDRVVCYQKEGINAGASGTVRYFPDWDINVCILSNMETGAWKPIWKIHDLIVQHAFGAKLEMISPMSES
ncbi:MAG: beta-lactamase family protein [Chloroflexi bacterium]|nr:beta-lactamase family protein [Chloroflexota bacterium]